LRTRERIGFHVDMHYTGWYNSYRKVWTIPIRLVSKRHFRSWRKR
jgi:hypothetical protein